MTIFHILDAISQDIKIERETETTREIKPLAGDLTDDDDEVIDRRKKKSSSAAAGAGGSYTQLKMVIHLFGMTAAGEYLRTTVNSFEPFFFVGLPDATRRTRQEFEAQLQAKIKTSARNLQGAVAVTYESRKKLYGFTASASFPFAKLSVASLCAFRALKKLFLNGETSTPIFDFRGDALPVFEANLDPMLRFFHLRNIKPCGWASTEDEAEDGLIETEWDAISPATPPVASAPFLLAAWDIECYSENGEFPVPKKGYDRLAKLLFADWEDAGAASQAIVGAAVYPEAPPKGMDPLRKRGGGPVDRDSVEAALGPAFQDALAPLLKNKDGLSATSKTDRIHAIRDVLSKALCRVLPLAGDPIIQIGVVLTRGGAPAGKHIFVLGTCDAVEGATVYPYENEKDLIVGWLNQMRKWNPDILVGYNVFGFDEKYLWGRAEELKITGHESMQCLSRLRDMEKEVVLEEKMLSSSALGDNMMYIMTAHGRLQVDLYHYIKRSFSLAAYKLDSVCQHFMSGKLAGVDTAPPSDPKLAGVATWHLKTKATGDVVIGRYVVLLDETGDVVVDKLKIVGVIPKEAVIVEAPTTDDLADLAAATADAVKWATVKDDVSPQDIFRLQRGSAADRAKVAAYCVQDCDLVVELYKKLDVFNNAMAMANACSVPVGYIFTRGQGIKIESLIFKECYERGQCVAVMPTQPRGAVAQDAESYEGAIVLTPTPGFYFKSPVGVADFASLYPSTIISENISHDSLVWAKDYALDGSFLGISYGAELDDAGTGAQWTDIEFDIWGSKEGDTRKHPEKVKRGVRVCRYFQPAEGKGTLPDIVQKLLAARKAKRKEAEKEADPFKKALLDAEQLAYKLTANSLYGQLGSPTFKIRLQHLAASVTAYGRKQILFAKAAIEQFYGPEAGRPDCSAETVYGDTDSLFINFNVRDPTTGAPLEGREAIVATQRLTEEAGKMVTTCLKAPHDFEYDKVFSPFIIFSKKRYVGNKYEESPDEYYQNSMGIATKRRDYAGIVKVIYGGAIRILLTDRDPVAAAAFVKTKLMDLAEGRVSLNQLLMTKSLRAEYATPTPPAHKVLANRIAARDPGNAPASGDRVSFLYVMPPVGQQASKLQGDRVETPAFVKEKGLKVDAKFYMEHQLMNPISQLFALIVEQLPGCPVAKTEDDREYIAGEYLFRAALDACDKGARSRLAAKLGMTVLSSEPRRSERLAVSAAPAHTATATAHAKPVAKTQMKMTLFTEKYLLDKLSKTSKKAATAAADKPKSQSPSPK
jgi:DNA polymerase elongation subunit (family B)